MRPARAPALLASLAGLSLGLAACDSIRAVFMADSDEQPESTATAVANIEGRTESGGDPTPQRGEREVEFPVTAQSVTDELFPNDGARFAEATVPVLAPAAMSREQASSFVSSYRTTPDGYFARLGLEEFDIVVNGTRMFAVAPQGAGAPSRDTTAYQFSESDTGMSVTFNRFGADYSIDFVCRGPGGEGSACVSEAEAAEFVERLVPVGGGGR
jgi:hypothetical protein